MLYDSFFSVIGDFGIGMRASFALLSSLIITFLFGKRFIRILKKWQKEGQPIREDGPQSHIKEKTGTPTMGGLLIILATLGGACLWGNFSNKYLILCIITLLGFGFLGFLDDYKKLKHKSSGGVSAKTKFLIQFLLALALIFCIVKTQGFAYGTTVYVFSPSSIYGLALDIGVFYYIFGGAVVAGASNAVNLTDGLDGLATLPICLCAFCLCAFGIVASDIGLSYKFGAQYVEGSEEVVIIAASLIGASLGFLWYNTKPAQIFMGDVGSLSIGALLGIISIILKREIAFAIVGGLFIIETISVMIQVVYFKKTKKRVFKMAPLHHHFEKKGWPEFKVVVRFWILAFIFAILGLMTL